jgi:hypothetical protein
MFRLLVPCLASVVHRYIHFFLAMLVPNVLPTHTQAGKNSQTRYAYQEVKDITQAIRVRSQYAIQFFEWDECSHGTGTRSSIKHRSRRYCRHVACDSGCEGLREDCVRNYDSNRRAEVLEEDETREGDWVLCGRYGVLYSDDSLEMLMMESLIE